MLALITYRTNNTLCSSVDIVGLPRLNNKYLRTTKPTNIANGRSSLHHTMQQTDTMSPPDSTIPQPWWRWAAPALFFPVPRPARALAPECHSPTPPLPYPFRVTSRAHPPHHHHPLPMMILKLRSRALATQTICRWHVTLVQKHHKSRSNIYLATLTKIPLNKPNLSCMLTSRPVSSFPFFIAQEITKCYLHIN